MNDLTQLIPIAVGVMISPLPIVAAVALLLSARGRVNGLAFVGASVVVVFGWTLLGGLTASRAGAGHSDGDDVVVLVITAVLALGFLVLAVTSWLGRPRNGEPAKTPSWLAVADTLTPVRSAGLGALMGVTNAKNIPLALKAGALIGAHDLPVVAVVGVSAVFAVCASLVLIVLVLLAASRSQRIAAALQRLKAELIGHNAIIMSVLFLLLAASEIGHLLHALLH